VIEISQEYDPTGRLRGSKIFCAGRIIPEPEIALESLDSPGEHFLLEFQMRNPSVFAVEIYPSQTLEIY
jgi:hypothetical protein